MSLNIGLNHIIGDKTYDAVAYLEFDDMTGLEAYMQHPLHAELAGLFWKYCESTIFLDAVVVDPATMDIWSVFGPET